LKKETTVALSSIIALSVIVVAFLLFAVVLAWAERQTRNIANETKNEQPAPRQQGQSRPAAERKAPALINS
jgi:lipopolysaccharide export LptBFGC system permease protein LptF